MIEVEKKFLLTTEEIQRLTAHSEFLEEIRLEDVYYDLPGYPLMKHDKYLRSRNGRFELKLPAGDRGEFEVDRYREITNEDEINRELALGEGNTADLLNKIGYSAVATIGSVRKKYRDGEFTIDVDETDFGYNLVEIELMAKDEDKIANATNKIISFALRMGIEVKPEFDVRGKLLEFLYREKPEVYEEIVQFWRSTGSTRL